MKRLILLSLMLLSAAMAWAQYNQHLNYDTVRVGDQWALRAQNPRYKRMNVKMVYDIKRDTTDNWRRRLMVQTNVVDWALTLPNITIGIDLGSPFVRTTPTLLIGMRNTFGMYRWYNQENSYDYQGVKVELRRHWVPRKYRQEIITEEPPTAPGRFYAGVFGEYSWANHLDGHNYKPKENSSKTMWVPYGPSFIGGMSWGYELRKRNYNHRIHMNWDFGVDVGVLYAPKLDHNFLPVVSDLRVALNFRKDRINYLYWKPNVRDFSHNANFNREMRIYLDKCRARIDSMGGVDIYVTSVDGDSLFKEVIEQNDVVKEIVRQLNFKALKQGKLTRYETSPEFPIKDKALGEYYSLDYRFGMRPENKMEEDYGTDTISFSFPFRVRLKGYMEADSTIKVFEKRVEEWRASHDNSYPVLKMKHLDREHVKGHATIGQIVALFKEITGVEIKPEQITGIYYKGDSLMAVNEEDINLRMKQNCYYTFGFKLHPQCMVEAGELSTRFVLDFNDGEQLQKEFSMLARYFNSNPRIEVQRIWMGNNKNVTPVEAAEIVDAIAESTNDSINFLTPSMIELADSANTMGMHRFNLNYDALFMPISDRRYYVTDTLGRAEAAQIHKVIKEKGGTDYYNDYDADNYPTIVTEDPADQSLITAEMVAAVMSRYYGIHVSPYMISMPVYKDKYNTNEYKQPWENHPDTYRGMALVRLHPDYLTNVRFYYRVAPLKSPQGGKE